VAVSSEQRVAQQALQSLGLRSTAMQQGVEMHCIGFVKTTEVAGEDVDFIGRIAPDHHLIQRLQGKPTCTGTCGTGAGSA
jgi:hypothetical protein